MFGLSVELCYFAAGFLLIILLKSSWVQYAAKMSMFGLVSFFSGTFPTIPFFIARPLDYRNAFIPAFSLRWTMNLIGVTYEVRGKEYIDKTKGGVVLINHQSFLDLVVLAYLWPIIGRATVVAKRAVMFFYPACFFWGTLFIDRSHRSESQQKLNKESVSINTKQSKLLMFPEGTRNISEQLKPFKKGPFHIAIQSQCSIQPVVVSRYFFLNGHNFGRGHIIISILPEINCNGLTKTELPALLDKTQEIMQEEYTKITAESRSTKNRHN